MSALRVCANLILALLIVCGGAWTTTTLTAVAGTPIPTGIEAVDWEAIQTEFLKLITSTGGYGGEVQIDGDTAVLGGGRWVTVIYRNQGGQDAWGVVATLTTDDYEARGYGNSVALHGDIIVIGAPEAFIGDNTYQGSAYIYYRNQGGPDAWGQVARIYEPEGSSNDNFAASVSVHGDTIVVGVPHDFIGVNNAQGSAIVYYRNQGGTDAWGQVTKVIAYDGNDNYYFGNDVSINGDTLLVGAHQTYNVIYKNWPGAAYLFDRNQNGTDQWGYVIKLVAPEITVARFAESVWVESDTAIIGAYASDIDGKADQGSAYVYDRNLGGTNAWGRVTRLTANDGEALDYFGIEVSLNGDSALIGARRANTNDIYMSGAAYVFDRDLGGIDAWGQASKLIASSAEEQDQLGTSVSISGGIAMCGAPYVDLGDLYDRGAMYIYYNMPVIIPPGDITITGDAQGLTGITYPFTAVVSPYNTALPLTFTWQATGSDPVTHIVNGLSDTVAYTWTDPGAKSLTVTATNSVGQVVGTHLVDIYLGVAHIEAIEMQYKIYQVDQYQLIANIQVLDQDGNLIPDVSVSARWTMPDGSILEDVATPMKTGWTRFKVKSGLAGVYMICVTDISLLNWLYNENQNQVTCASMAVP